MSLYSCCLIWQWTRRRRGRRCCQIWAKHRFCRLAVLVKRWVYYACVGSNTSIAYFLWAIKDNRGGLFHFGIHPNSIQHLLKITKVIFARASLGSWANVNFLAKLEEGGCEWRVGEQVVSYGVEIRVSRKLSRTAETFTFANMHLILTKVQPLSWFIQKELWRDVSGVSSVTSTASSSPTGSSPSSLSTQKEALSDYSQ